MRLSLVESKNKPLDDIEKVVYRKKCIRIWGVEIICAAAALVVYRLAAVCIMAAHVVIALALVIGGNGNSSIDIGRYGAGGSNGRLCG